MMSFMDESKRIEVIKQRLESDAYFINPLSDANVRDDLAYLLSLLRQKDLKIDQLEKKAKALSTHAMELSQEMENIKSDFGSNPR
jgi:hypothetical protein